MKPAIPRGKPISTITVSAPMMTDSPQRDVEIPQQFPHPDDDGRAEHATQIDDRPPMITPVMRLSP